MHKIQTLSLTPMTHRVGVASCALNEFAHIGPSQGKLHHNRYRKTNPLMDSLSMMQMNSLPQNRIPTRGCRPVCF